MPLSFAIRSWMFFGCNGVTDLNAHLHTRILVAKKLTVSKNI